MEFPNKATFVDAVTVIPVVGSTGDAPRLPAGKWIRLPRMVAPFHDCTIIPMQFDVPGEHASNTSNDILFPTTNAFSLMIGSNGLLTTIPTRALRIWFPDTTTFRQSTRMPSRTALRAVAASMEVGISQSTELPSTTAEFAESGV